MENQDDNQNQNQITCTVMIKKNYKTETNKEKGIDINATLVFDVPDDDHYNFLQEKDIQKEVVLVQKCTYENKGHQYIVNDEICAGSTLEDWKNQKLTFEQSQEDDFPFEKLIYFLDKNSLTLEDNSLKIDILIKLIATDSTCQRSPKEFLLQAISFDQAAKDYIKKQFEDCTENVQQILSSQKEIQFPVNYPEKFRDKLNLLFKINQIIQPGQSVSIEKFQLKESNLNIQNVYVYTCYQVTIKSTYFAQPLRILSKQQLSNPKNLIDVELKYDNVSQVPFIYDSDKITCKHFLIINLQYKKFYQIQGIDILVPIVIIDPQKKHSYYINKNEINEYFKMKISESMVTLTLNQPNQNYQNFPSQRTSVNQEDQDNIRLHYKQLLNSVNN